MSDGFYRIPCKTCSLDYHRPGAYKERLQFRAQMKRTVEILNGEMNPPIPLPINPPPSAGVS